MVMGKMGKYCKAYTVEDLKQFAGWKEKTGNFRQATEKTNQDESAIAGEQAGRPFLYLQENLTVTDGIFLDEKIVFDDISSEWKTFCQETLKFEIPDYASRSQHDASENTRSDNEQA
jgi:hypothetical protein